MADDTPSNQTWLDRNRATWNERAADWDTMSESRASAPGRSAELDRIAAALHLKPGDQVFDAGCGSGQWSLQLAQRGYRVTGVDLAPDMIERASAHSASDGVAVEWRLGDLSRLDDPDDTYDAIHARLALQFTPDMAAALTEFRRVLKPGALLLAGVPGALSPIYSRSWRRFIEPELHTNSYATPWELEALLQHLGWEIIGGWGGFGHDAYGNPNPMTAESAADFPIPLQQAACTLWTTVAR